MALSLAWRAYALLLRWLINSIFLTNLKNNSAETCKRRFFKNSEGEEEKCVSKVLCKWFIKAFIVLLPLFIFFWFCLPIVLVVVVVFLEVKFWKRQSPVRRMMLSIKRESAKLFQQNKVSSYKISIIWMALDAPEFHVKRLEIWPRIDRSIWPIKVFFCRVERDTKIVWLKYWPSFPSISSCANLQS